MQKIDVKELQGNFIEMVGDRWMLVTAGSERKFNTMTASWGGFGCLWNKPVAFVFIRPQRYTFEFTEREDKITLSFFDESYKKALMLCGTKSGRDTDKVTQAGLTPMVTEGGNVAFNEAEIVLEGRKIYAAMIDEQNFIDTAIVNRMYPDRDFHKMYIIELEGAYIK